MSAIVSWLAACHLAFIGGVGTNPQASMALMATNTKVPALSLTLEEDLPISQARPPATVLTVAYTWQLF